MEGDQMKMRAALIRVLRLANVTADGENWDRNNAIAEKVVKVVKEALALPPRQCDVGTPYEQANRMRQFCDKQKRNGIINCGYCPIKHQYQRDCTLAWAQMPYAEEGGAK